MKFNSTTLFGRLFAILLMLVLIGSYTNAQVQKRVLLEEFTGEWCTYCPAGAIVMKEVVDKYQGKVLAAAFHWNDWLEISEVNDYRATMGVSSYPSAFIDRWVWNIAQQGQPPQYATAIGRGGWDQAAGIVLNDTADVDVKLLYQWNNTSRQLKMDISGTFQKDMTGIFRFNVYIIENDIKAVSQVSGGSNYYHQHVVRKLMGGSWGTESIIPPNVKNGEKYNYSYTFNIPADWNWANVKLIGVVQKYHTNNGDRQILNCVEGVEGQADMEFTCTAGSQTSVVGFGETTQSDFEIKNLTNTQRTYNINVTKSSRTPSNWNATVLLPSGAARTSKDGVLADELVIGPLGKKTVTLQLTPGDMIGIGDAEISVKEKNNSSATEGKGSVTAVSAEIDKFQVVDDAENGAKSLGATITNSGNTGYFDINSSDFVPIYNKFNKLNTIVWTFGEEGTLSDEEAGAIKTMIDGGTPILISGALSVPEMEFSSPNLMFKVGCSYGGNCWQGESSGWNFTIVGYPNDPITNGFDRTFQKGHWITQAIDVNNPKTFPILKHKFADTIVAVRSEVSNARIVLIGFNPVLITNLTARNNLIGNSLKWLNGVGPKIASSVTELDFGDVAVNSQKDMTVDIENTGEEVLNVSEMTVEWEYSNVFTIVSPSVPFSVQPGMSETVTARFKPSSEFGYDVDLTIKSNAVNDGEIVVNLKGNGTASNAGPEISADVQAIDFGEVPINDPKDRVLEITNTGEQALSISSLNIVSDVSDIFEVVSPASFPVTVQPGAKTNITIKFSPVEKISYKGVIEINSNAINGNKLSVDLDGIGGNAVGVQDEDGNSISVSVGPNPFSSKTTISYTVAGNGGMVNISVIDARGMTVSGLISKNLAAGDYSVVFDAKGLSSGVYYIIARINGKALHLPIVIEK